MALSGVKDQSGCDRDQQYIIRINTLYNTIRINTLYENSQGLYTNYTCILYSYTIHIYTAVYRRVRANATCARRTRCSKPQQLIEATQCQQMYVHYMHEEQRLCSIISQRQGGGGGALVLVSTPNVR